MLVGLAACSQLESEEAKEVAREAKVVAKEATEEVVQASREVAKATKEQLDKVDTEKIEQTLEDVAGAMGTPSVEDPTNPDPDPLADAARAIACDEARSRCTVTADFADRARRHGSKLAAQLRMSASSGDMPGIRIDAIDAGTVAELVGLKVGDVITHVNGTALGSPQDAVMLYMSVRSAQSFVIDYQRTGTARTLQVDVV